MSKDLKRLYMGMDPELKALYYYILVEGYHVSRQENQPDGSVDICLERLVQYMYDAEPEGMWIKLKPRQDVDVR